MKKENKKSSLFMRFLRGVEVVGNKLPHPVTLFALLCLILAVISAVCAALGVSATGDILNRATNEVETQTFKVVSLFTSEGFRHMLSSAIGNFTGFAPLGIVLVAMLGVGAAEHSGYISALLRRAVAVSPKKIITPVIVLLGVLSNIATDIGYVVLIPLGALVFKACGRHPMAGLAAAFAGVSGGFSANLIVGATEPLLSGISTEAANLFDPSYVVEPTANFYFMFVSTFLITLLGTLITDKIVEPRLGGYSELDALQTEEMTIGEVSPREKKALLCANLTLAALAVLTVALLIPGTSFLRNPETGSLISGSPFMNNIVVIIAVLFFVPAVVFGFVSGKYKSDKDVAGALGEAMSSMGGYIALAFVAAQFVDYFSYTNLGTVIALKGAELLRAISLPGPVLMIIFIVFTAFINLFIGSASAKWAIMAPVFVPIFMAVGFSPELTQVAYRIGDSTTNIITPLMSYFAMIVVFAQKYDKKSGMGTIISTMLPYSVIFLVGWSLLLVVWMLLGLPLGPDAPLYIG